MLHRGQVYLLSRLRHLVSADGGEYHVQAADASRWVCRFLRFGYGEWEANLGWLGLSNRHEW